LGESDSSQAEARPRRRLLRLPSTFNSLRHRNYRLFFFGQMISLIGTWMQWTAQGWLVYQITGSKTMLGVIGMVATLPMLLLSNLGGVAADRFPRRTILLVTQTSSLIMPLILADLVLLGYVEVWHIALLAGLLGVVNSFDMPARQAFVVEMVGRDDLLNAIGLNSGIFNSARIMGPAVAGIVMASVGVGYCFMINGISYLAVIMGIYMMRLPDFKRERQMGSFLRKLVAGFAYVKKDKRLLGIMIILAIISIFGFSYTRLLPAFAKDIFNVGDLGYGEMLSFNGIGAIVGSLTVASMTRRKDKREALVAGVLIFCLAVTAFSLTSNFTSGLLMLLILGTGMIMFMTTANTMIQTIVPDEYRGRVMGVWAFVFGGSMPVGSLAVGVAAEYIGLALTVKIGALVCAFAALAASLVARNAGTAGAETQPPVQIQSPY
jgi:MFS family permease